MSPNSSARCSSSSSSRRRVSLFVTHRRPQNPMPYIDFGIIGFVHFFALFALVQGLAIVSGAHFNPAVTVAMTALRQIKPPDAVIYIICPARRRRRGRAADQAAAEQLRQRGRRQLRRPGGVRRTLDGKTSLGMIAEFIGTFFLVLTIVAVAVDPRVDRALAPLAIGVALGLGAFVFAPMTGASLNPARAFGPALVSGELARLRPVPARLRARAGARRPGGRDRLHEPARHAAGRRGRTRSSRSAESGRLRGVNRLGRGAAGHLLAQLHGFAVADVPVLLQVLRVRDASGPSLCARGGREAARRRRRAAAPRSCSS